MNLVKLSLKDLDCPPDRHRMTGQYPLKSWSRTSSRCFNLQQVLRHALLTSKEMAEKETLRSKVSDQIKSEIFSLTSSLIIYSCNSIIRGEASSFTVSALTFLVTTLFSLWWRSSSVISFFYFFSLDFLENAR